MMRLARSLFQVGAVLVVLVGILVYIKLGKFEGGPVVAPREAVPIWSNSHLSIGNKMFEYMFPLLIPSGTMAKCPLLPPHDGECMAKARTSVESLNVMAWESFLGSTHEETVIRINRTEYNSEEEDLPPLEVILLHPSNATIKLSEAPLILWIHGGGFTIGVARDAYMLSFVNAFLQDSSVPSNVKNAVWASVEYRLAPEHTFPAAPNDCLLALQYLLNNHTTDETSPERRLGLGGVHIGGVSAGGTLAANTALGALKAGIHIDSVLVDEPMFLSQIKEDNDGAMPVFLDSASHRQNAYSRIAPIRWLEWSVYAYMGRLPADSPKIPDSGFNRGVMSVSEWKSSAGELPPVVLMTAKADMLHDGGIMFKHVYEGAGGRVYHVDSSSSHGGAVTFDTKSVQDVVTYWSGLFQATT